MKKNKEVVFKDSILDQAWFNYWMNQLEESNVSNISQRVVNGSLAKRHVLKVSANNRTTFLYKLHIA